MKLGCLLPILAIGLVGLGGLVGGWVIDDRCRSMTPQGSKRDTGAPGRLPRQLSKTAGLPGKLRTALAALDPMKPQTASLSSLAARKATFLLALILIGSPVAGLRPMRAARLRT